MDIKNLISISLEEDDAFNDITTKEFIPKNKQAKAVLIADANGVLCGTKFFTGVFKAINKNCRTLLKARDCSPVKRGDRVLELVGPADAILSGERVALNFLQYMSGIATLTNKFVKAVGKKKVRIYDTRKILPGYRELAKYAVRCGGGTNHRVGLSDMALIKDNHLKFIKDLALKVNDFRKKYENVSIEVECENAKQVKQALDAKADILMLDNVNLKNVEKLINIIRKNSTKKYRPMIEVSGGVNLNTIRKISKFDVDRISVGMITHSSPALNFTLEIKLNEAL
jgi:nicotinate-nucleotide pyrophosphorylase (carboxylating)